jgi:hypothetical protein
MPQQYANLSFRVSPSVKQQFTLLTQLHGKKGVEVFSSLIKDALQTPLTNTQLRGLTPDLRKKILAQQSEQAKSICLKYAQELDLDEISDDLAHLP